jgi:hypothetical protein
MSDTVLPLCTFGNAFYLRFFIHENVVLDLGEHFPKQTWRNRYDIAGPNKIQPLTVPVIGRKGQKIASGEVIIDFRNNWMKQHLQSIRTAYGSSPFFEHYFELLIPLFNDPPELLADFNLSALHWTLEQLGLSPSFEISKTYIPAVEKKTDWRNVFKPSAFLSMNITAGAYLQVFSDRFGFRPHCSVLDLLFNLGPEATGVIRNFPEHPSQNTILGPSK